MRHGIGGAKLWRIAAGSVTTEKRPSRIEISAALLRDVAHPTSGVGPKPACWLARLTSAFGGRADFRLGAANVCK
jgi:hypothetical protein